MLLPLLHLTAAALARLIKRGPLHFVRLLLGRHLRLSGLIFGGCGTLSTHNAFNLLADIFFTTLLILLYFVLSGRS